MWALISFVTMAVRPPRQHDYDFHISEDMVPELSLFAQSAFTSQPVDVVHSHHSSNFNVAGCDVVDAPSPKG
jgi:hypothetical protein